MCIEETIIGRTLWWWYLEHCLICQEKSSLFALLFKNVLKNASVSLHSNALNFTSLHSLKVLYCTPLYPCARFLKRTENTVCSIILLCGPRFDLIVVAFLTASSLLMTSPRPLLSSRRFTIFHTRKGIFPRRASAPALLGKCCRTILASI